MFFAFLLARVCACELFFFVCVSVVFFSVCMCACVCGFEAECIMINVHKEMK